MRGVERLKRRAGRFVDRRLGTETAGACEESELGLDPARSVGYDPSRWLALPGSLPRAELTERDVFADLGSGKGRVVLQAALYYPFKRVIGVEFSPELNRIARQNLQARQDRLRCPDVELVTGDVAEWAPPEDLTIVWLFNPFRGELFSTVIERLAELVQRRGTPLRIIYLNPTEHERLMRARGAVRIDPPPWFRLKLAGIPPGWVNRYELRPPKRVANRKPINLART